MRKKICIFTGTRAEYGLLKPLIKQLKKYKQYKVQLLVSGMHMSPEFGLTYRDIQKDGFKLDEKVEILMSSDTPEGICKSMGIGMISFADVFKRLTPDLLIVLGDRYEALVVASVALIYRIPIAHIHGGEGTLGLTDEAIRHSITKMSHIHFTSTEVYRQRVIQLGEHPDTVFNVGALGIDNIKNLNLLSKKKLESILKIKFKKKNLLVTYHPVTLDKNQCAKRIKKIILVLDSLKDTLIIFTKSNSDTGGRIINSIIDEYVETHSDKAVCFSSLGQLNYLSIMQYVDAVVGNSSSGIIEAPYFKIGTINIGDRQKGRIKNKSIIDCDYTVKSIKKAFKTLYSKEFTKELKKVKNIYGEGNTAEKIAEILKKYNFKNLIKKEFFDLRR